MLRQLPIQEDIGEMIAKSMEDMIDPKGVGIIVQGEHSCMRMRGVRSACCDMTTTYMTGVFLSNQPAREEFLLL
jgi:GTP cyclohydrolase I